MGGAFSKPSSAFVFHKMGELKRRPIKADPTLLFISTIGAHWGGSEELWVNTATRLASIGEIKVHAYVKRWKTLHPRLKNARNAGVILHFWSKGFSSLPSKLFGKIARQDALAWHLWRIKPDLIVISNGGCLPTASAARALIKYRRPYINVAHSNHIGLFPDRAEIFRDYLIKASVCAFVSHQNWHMLESQVGMKLSNARVVRNPFNVPYDVNFSWASGISRPAKFASVARLHCPSKGQDILLEVLARPHWLERAWSLSLFGDGPHADTLRRLVELYGLKDRVAFHGHVPDIVGVWRDHDALVLPSRYEGLPLAIVEAMLCGRVVIATDVGGNAELIEDGVTGFVAEAPKTALFDGALERAWEHRKEWPEFGRRSRMRVESLVPRDPIADFIQIIKSTSPTLSDDAGP